MRLIRYFLESQSLKYLFSSCAAFAVNYVLLLILEAVLPVASLEIGAVIAWLTSSILNFTLNRNFVFRSSKPLRPALAEYYGLATVVFLLKTYILIEFMVRVLHIPIGFASPIAEVVFYVFNYFVQKLFIFKKKDS